MFEQVFLKPGLYTIGLKIFLLNNGSFGDPPLLTREIEVTAPPPTASFEASTLDPKPGEAVTFNGEGSIDPTGSCSLGKGCVPAHQLKSYTWSFGDGRTETTTTPEYTRSFANPSSEARTESVTLTVTNAEGVQSAPVTQTLTIQGTPEQPKEPIKEPVKEVPIVVPPVLITKPPVGTPAVKKPLTRAQKLAKALKPCKKDKSKKARVSCEKAARKKYASKPKKKHKKK